LLQWPQNAAKLRRKSWKVLAQLHSIVGQAGFILTLLLFVLLVQSSDIERQVQEKVDEFQNKREKDRKTLQEEVSKGISICAELDSTMRTMVEVIRAESQRISKCEMQIEALGDGDTIQFSFDAKQADFESLANQASSDITKIRASSKRRRSSLLKTLAVLGNDSN